MYYCEFSDDYQYFIKLNQFHRELFCKPKYLETPVNLSQG